MAVKMDCIKARSEYIELVKSELMGPGSEVSIPDLEHELLSTSPDKRYSIGVLYTKYNKFKMDNNDTARVESQADEVEEEIEDSTENDAQKERIEPVAPSEEESLDEEIGLATQNMPSSMGITFLVGENVLELRCKVSFATYRRAKVEDCAIPFFPANKDSFALHEQIDSIAFFDKEKDCLRLRHGGISRKDISALREKDVFEPSDDELISALYKLTDQLRSGYVRVPHANEILIDFSTGDYSDDNKNIDGTKAKITSLKRKIGNGLYSITVMLVNDDDSDSRGDKCLFQPQIEVSSDINGITFQEYSKLTNFEYLSDEEQSLDLQYRNKKVYGTGLGTSVEWDVSSQGEGIVRSEFFPKVEVPAMDFEIPEKYDIEKDALSMKVLSDLDGRAKNEKVKFLYEIVNAYEKWIGEQEEKSKELDKKFTSISEKMLAECRDSLGRMKRGIEILEENGLAWDAFTLANRAMFMQRVQINLQETTSNTDRYPGDEELTKLINSIDYLGESELTKNRYFWRPFQLAFMLMSISAITDDESPFRDLVDLIWFPTGGGKTEAYLLLTAFTIFYRRLSHGDVASGTTVIMRYTLRLLATQQFTRASTLICACEFIREDSLSRCPKYKGYDLGKSPISIGLWIGNEHVPNTNTEAKRHLKMLVQATTYDLQITKEMHNKFQVLKCPWCGTKMVKDRVGDRMIGAFGYRMRNNRNFELFCPQESCYFNKRGTLPIQIIDQELYNSPPTLLFGTVDKFAMIPWKAESGNFFAVNTNDRPPELIIQDELHLISGPLGTMVGLYEAIIDLLCQDKGCRPKIVASTATIRRAKEQCAALYNREVNQFPNPGINAEDSFFAREIQMDYSKEKFGRMYVGLMPSGKSKAMMEIRSIATLMQTVNVMELTDEVRDKYWTLTVYFNSLRDLGKCSTLVDDEVKEFIRRAAYRLGTNKNARAFGRADELTSRVTTTQLNETLEKLEKITYSKENNESKRYASNILLATNMISVGIDVARLNVMLMVNQPKLTSEYIQASSRVGRSFPGVVFAMYDGSKSRDRSHYEQFKSYHESFYKYVEPTGATPFSKPARDRALHAVIITMLRMLEDTLRQETDASSFQCDKYAKRIEEIKVYMLSRAREVTKKINVNMEDESDSILHEIETVLEKWEQLARNYGTEHFCYGDRYIVAKPDEGEGRLLKSYNTQPNDPAFDTMTSMRNVDLMIGSSVLIWEE